ncbi:hypothetical protein [Peteryoungia ipomoeae]|uniref:Uncharacterized protein n=1 Tax=Peteryoungia ipomoeae TaxID=1210932 RepID=A0A4S8NZC1_9HYPH|nr:hypothetical protein [Peteryoungia ipomoeae]THV20499.1 hypothetical protein FAA97_18025 [Peteryoungia ipomoeae]
MQIVRELDVVEVNNDLHPARRVIIVQREDGFYAYAEQYHFVSKHEGKIVAEGWGTLPGEGIYAYLHDAEIEGRAAFARRHGVDY